MDWYYLILGGAMRGACAHRRALGRVRGAGQGRTLRASPAVGDGRRDQRAGTGSTRSATPSRRDRACRVHSASARSRWIVLDRLVFSDGRKALAGGESCWTSAAVVLAADAISRTSAANGIFRDVRSPLGDAGRTCYSSATRHLSGRL